MFECLAGYPPFSSESGLPEETYRMVLNWKEVLDFELGRCTMSPEAKELIRGLCCDANTRLGKNGVQEIKEHAFFKGIDWDNIHKMTPPFVPKLKDDFDTINFPPDDLLPDREDYSQFDKQANRKVPNFTWRPTSNLQRLWSGGSWGDTLSFFQQPSEEDRPNQNKY